MPRYIDKDALLEFLKVNKYEEPSTDFQRGANANADLIFGEIKYFHTADVVQVVRCKDCKHYKPQPKYKNSEIKYCCRSAYVRVNANDFCSYGTRKENK